MEDAEFALGRHGLDDGDRRVHGRLPAPERHPVGALSIADRLAALSSRAGWRTRCATAARASRYWNAPTMPLGGRQPADHRSEGRARRTGEAGDPSPMPAVYSAVCGTGRPGGPARAPGSSGEQHAARRPAVVSCSASNIRMLSKRPSIPMSGRRVPSRLRSHTGGRTTAPTSRTRFWRRSLPSCSGCMSRPRRGTGSRRRACRPPIT